MISLSEAAPIVSVARGAETSSVLVSRARSGLAWFSFSTQTRITSTAVRSGVRAIGHDHVSATSRDRLRSRYAAHQIFDLL